MGGPAIIRISDRSVAPCSRSRAGGGVAWIVDCEVRVVDLVG
jgi:hypothetical protein